jgi:hypothetical protein
MGHHPVVEIKDGSMEIVLKPCCHVALFELGAMKPQLRAGVTLNNKQKLVKTTLNPCQNHLNMQKHTIFAI